MAHARQSWQVLLAGIAFLVLGFAGSVTVESDAPDFVDDAQSIAAYYEDDPDRLLAGGTMYLLAVGFLLWFTAHLHARLRGSQPSARPTATAALAGAVAGAALLLAAAGTTAVGALRVDENDAIAPEVATVLFDLGSILYGGAAPMAFAVLVLAVAVAALREGSLPRWLGFVSVPMGVALAIPPIAFFAVIVFSLWVPLTAVAMATTSVEGT